MLQSIQIFKFSFVFQIRAEKPYYMADPEVDSLVSKISSFFYLYTDN